MDEHSPESRREEALARFLALRAPDLDGWEEEEARRLPDARLQAELERDDVLEEVLERWAEGRPSPRAVPSVEAILRAVEARDHDPLDEDEIPQAVPVAPPPPPVGLAPTLALAAALAVAFVGLWKLRPDLGAEGGSLPAALEASQRTKSGPGTDDAATRVELQWSVERQEGDRVVVLPGQAGERYPVTAGLALRAEVRGEGGYFYLVEAPGSGHPHGVWPLSGQALKLAAGAHTIVDEEGDPLVYRPDAGTLGAVRYLALLTTEEVEPAAVAEAVLATGLDKPSLWPRALRAADAFELTWEAASP
jgi:hypothetical protein